MDYQVHLVDAMFLHLQQALEVAGLSGTPPLRSIVHGDARHLCYPSISADAVILHGPLYHLTEKEDRLAVLQETRRIMRPGGVLLAVCISRYASLLVGLMRGWIDDPAFRDRIFQELEDGQHRRPPGWTGPGLFTTAYFHHPDECRQEIEAAGMSHVATLAVQGPAWIVPDIDGRWGDPHKRAFLLDIARRLETEKMTLGLSPHLVIVGRK
jgi:SAM-dependent methyltransferase